MLWTTKVHVLAAKLLMANKEYAMRTNIQTCPFFWIHQNPGILGLVFWKKKISNAECTIDINKTESTANTCILYVCSGRTRVHNNIYMNRYEALLKASKNQD